MSDRIIVTSKLDVQGGEVGSFIGATSAKSISVTVERRITSNPAIPTSWTAISLPSIELPYWIGIRNDDPTNYVEVAGLNDGTGLVIFLPPKPASGEGYVAVFCCNDATLFARANTATCNISVLAGQPLVA